MKQLMTAFLIYLAFLAMGCKQTSTTTTNLTEAQVLELVNKGTAQGKSYLILKKSENSYDVIEQ